MPSALLERTIWVLNDLNEGDGITPKAVADIEAQYNNDNEDDLDATGVDSTPLNKSTTKDPKNTNVNDQPNTTDPTIDPVEDALNSDDPGKAFLLDKIYTRLVTVSKYMDNFSDPSFDQLKSDLYDGIDMFHVFVKNYDTYRDKLDNLINLYNDFLLSVTEKLDKMSRTS